ncbi:carbamoyl phosphate synthase small subunit [Ornithinibacillus sp. L9]|uniref:Carbamoyl phosphate synthase small chain n=1 Tax=Ornithinibacillus caprae TaxID=2678566 RepID=A0A6N8FF99_9BACI|nr:carbamoyl phosphate synthase small subunit [Ornithinibacillus caprae]MUK86904.1 carbamoyl phosphate synthase small subunit [Ornithinibacillus caprae]
MNEQTGYLVLSTGDVLEGKWLGDILPTEGEVVFNTAMTGYQEVMTDPSYAGQIVTMTYPLIGNYGVNEVDSESIMPSLSGLIISYPCVTPEHYQSTKSIREMITEYKIPTLYGIDTRELTRIIRDNGEVYGRISTNKNDHPTKNAVDQDIVPSVSVSKIRKYTITENELDVRPHIVLMDFGYKQSIVQSLLDLGCDVTVVPYDTNPNQILELRPHGILLSNGPGDPNDLSYLIDNIKVICENYKVLGICFGHQLIALAHGAKITRLSYGHRGSNHPVKNLLTGKVSITSQNHGYIVDPDTIEEKNWIITFRNVNDGSIEGLCHRSKQIITVQFHPEAHPGPIDTQNIFSDFVNEIVNKGMKLHA